MQECKVPFSVPVSLPENLVLVERVDLEREDLVLVERIELERLKEMESNTDIWWTMKDLEKRLKRRHVWIKEKVLFPSKFRKILDCENGGFVYYPQSQGESWVFESSKMKEFLKENFSEIYSNY